MAFLQAAMDTVVSVQTEITIFLLAIVVHWLMFSRYRITGKKNIAGGAKNCKRASSSAKLPTEHSQHQPLAQSPGVLNLVRQVKSLLRDDANQEAIARVLTEHTQSKSKEDAVALLSALLEQLGKAATVSLIAAVHAVLQARELSPSGRLGELLLRGLLYFRQYEEFDQVFAEVEKEGPLSPAAASLALRASIHASDFDSALRRLPAFSAICSKEAPGNDSASAAPQQILIQLAQLAAKKGDLDRVLKELCEYGLFTPWIVEALLTDAGKRSGHFPEAVEAFEKTLQLARAREVDFSSGARAALIRRSSSPVEARELLAEAGASSPEVLLVAAEMAETHGDAALAADVLRLVPETKPSLELAATAVRLCAAQADGDAAILRLYEEPLAGLDILGDASAGHLVASAALRRGRTDLLQRLLSTGPGGPRQIALLKGFGTKQRVEDAKAIFNACPSKTTVLYNAILDVSIECGQVSSAEQIMKEATDSGLADVITYNTIIKAHLQSGSTTKARKAIEAMRAAGLQPNVVTFNELIDETLKHSRCGAWDLIEEMQACGLQPNPVTCSILLKSIQKSSRQADIEKTLAIMNAVEGGMDEVLLSSFCEACIRANRANLLKDQLHRHRGPGGVNVQGAHTYGSIIRAYGFVKDLRGVWDAWKEMRSRHILPTSITLGCMMEALVTNDGPDAGYQLISEVLEDEKMRPLLNSVIYCSVLKGYCHQKRFDRFWNLYQEMVMEKLEFSITTYNTLIDACARSCEMARVPKFLDEMAKVKIEPNIITYSTILKGYCQENRLDQAFTLLEDMKKTKFMPDEITYNTLLDGCARHGLYEKGLGVLKDMQANGVKPSNFTLSVAVKMANRGNRPDQAFELCHEISQKYNLVLNIHVYNNLMQACTQHWKLPRALSVFQQILQEQIRPDVRSYTILLRGCIAAGEAQTAADLLRAAAGLEQTHPKLGGFAAPVMRPSDGLSGDLVSETLGDIAGKCGNEGLALQVLQELRRAPGVRLDPKLSLRLTNRAIQAPTRR